MSTKRLFVYLGAALLLVLGCNTLSGGSGDPAVPEGVDRANALFVAGGQPRTLDPARTYSGPGDAVGAIFSGLVTLDTALQAQPDLAAGWQISEDGTLYTFYLRRHATFHDGRPVTAHDVVFSWERAADPATGSDTAATYLGDIVGVRDRLDGRADRISGLQAIDDHTLTVRIDAPKVYFLAKLTFPVAFVVDRHNVAQANWEHQANGSGPFTLERWVDDEIIVLARNERFYLEPPAVGHVVYSIGAGIPLSLYETGQIDLVGIGGGALERLQDPTNPLSAELRRGANMCTSFVGLNTRAPPFDDPLVRQAFNYALDKELLIRTLENGDALAATSVLPPGMPGYSDGNGGYPYDPERARQLLAQAGYPDGQGFPTITYYSGGFDNLDAFVTAVISLWQDTLGIAVEPVLLESYIYLEELFAGRVGNLFSYGWCADYPDPENFLDVLFHSASTQNLGGYANPAVDALLEQARSEQDVPARLALYGRIEQLLVEDAPVVLYSHSLSAVLVRPYVRNYVLTPISVPQWRTITIDRGP